MGSFSDYLEDKLLDHVFKTAAYTPATNLYIALCDADPTDAGTGASMNEIPNAQSYVRVVCNAWDTSSGGATENTNAVTFAEAAGSWGTISHFAIVDSITYGAGNMIAHGQLTTPKTIGAGDTLSFAAGAIDITLD